jgi:hypothetical protein
MADMGRENPQTLPEADRENSCDKKGAENQVNL